MKDNKGKYEVVHAIPIKPGMKIFATDTTTFLEIKEQLNKYGFVTNCDETQLSIYVASLPLEIIKTAQPLDLKNHDCSTCKSYRTCISFALDGNVAKCLYFGKLKSDVEEAVSKFNNIPEEYRLSREEIEQLIFETTRK